MCVHGAWGKTRGMSDPMKQELQRVVRCHCSVSDSLSSWRQPWTRLSYLCLGNTRVTGIHTSPRRAQSLLSMLVNLWVCPGMLRLTSTWDSETGRLGGAPGTPELCVQWAQGQPEVTQPAAAGPGLDPGWSPPGRCSEAVDPSRQRLICLLDGTVSGTQREPP